MKTRHLGLCAAFCLFPLAAQAQLAELTVLINGLEPAAGTVEVSLFNSEEDFLKHPLLQQSASVDGQEQLVFRFSGLLDGEYAVVVVHDENGNGLLDTGFLGFGGESYGYSNNAVGWFTRPSFSQAGFMVGAEDLEITIDLE